MKTIVRTFLLIVFIALNFVGTNGQTTDSSPEKQPLQEVFQTELVYPQEKGELQITFAPRFSRRESERQTEFPTRLEYGITNLWQVEVEFTPFSRRRELESSETERGIGDVSVSTKYSFLNIKNSNFHSSVQFEVGFPTGNVNRELSEGFIEYEPSVSFARDFPRLNRLQVFSQIGVNFVQRVKKPRNADEIEQAAHEFKLGGGFFAPVKKGRIVGEINWNTNQWNNFGKRSEVYLTPGFVYKFSRNFEFGIGTPIGVSRDADNLRTILQAVFEF